LLLGGSAFLNSRTELIVALADRHALPATCFNRDAVVAGGLIGCGASGIRSCPARDDGGANIFSQGS
jgi:hypothetical protein